MQSDPSVYKSSVILDLAQRAFGSGKGHEMKPLKWLVSFEDLHRFMVFTLQDHGVIKKVVLKDERDMGDEKKPARAAEVTTMHARKSQPKKLPKA